MTLFVASLYLPYTIDFHVAKKQDDATSELVPADANGRGASAYDATAPVPNLLHSLASKVASKAESVQATPPLTPSAELAESNIFVKTASNAVSAMTEQFKKALTQPHSRAGSPPPSSILKVRPAIENKEELTVSGAPKPFATPKVTKKLAASVQDQAKLFAEASWSVEPAQRGNGGLRNAIRAAYEAKGIDDTIWVGTVGMPTDVLEEGRKTAIEDKLRDEHDCLTVFCKDSDFDGHYNHFCKQILWPVFHYQIPDNPKSKAYEDHSWVFYVALNQAFADKIVSNYKKGDIIWVHDYHLLLVPKMVRDKIPDAMIGIFLHVAFPSSEVYRCLAVRKQLLEGMLGANLIGFQNEEYTRHFLQTCNRILRAEAIPTGVHLEDRFVNVLSSAIGIDPVILAKERENPEVDEWIKLIRGRYGDKKVLVARDKLDHVRGVRQKMLAYELFLKKYPEWKDKVVLIQVAIPTNNGKSDLAGNVLEIVSRINSMSTSLSHQPVIFLQQDISYSQYLALLTVADCLVTTTLREGMNLTCHEFVFCQDEKYSPLILSEFTGSSSLFAGSEISVNPWDYVQCANAMNQALEMPEKERKTRWDKLFADVMQKTAAHWVMSFISALQRAWLEEQRRGNVSVPRLSLNNVGNAYANADKRLFILDFEDTLAPWGDVGDVVLTSPQRVIDTLNDLLLDSRNMVYLMSSRKPEELDRLFALVSGLGLIAENGCFIRPRNAATWIEMVEQSTLTWKKSVDDILEYYLERTPGAWIERRHCSFVFHLDKVDDEELADRQAGDCANHVNDTCENQNVHCVPLDKGVIVEPQQANKATAAAHVLGLIKEEEKGAQGEAWAPDFLFVAGDGREDDVVFTWANSLAEEGSIHDVFTVCVGNKNTEATSTLTQGPTGLLSALHRISKYK